MARAKLIPISVRLVNRLIKLVDMYKMDLKMNQFEDLRIKNNNYSLLFKSTNIQMLL